MNRLQQAYVKGFCKAAESYGVDPSQLMKTAQSARASAMQRAAAERQKRRYLQERNQRNIDSQKWYNRWGRGIRDFATEWPRTSGTWNALTSGDTWNDAYKNTELGATILNNGVAREAMRLPGDVAGGLNSLWSGITGDGMVKGFNRGRDAFNRATGLQGGINYFDRGYHAAGKEFNNMNGFNHPFYDPDTTAVQGRGLIQGGLKKLGPLGRSSALPAGMNTRALGMGPLGRSRALPAGMNTRALGRGPIGTFGPVQYPDSGSDERYM